MKLKSNKRACARKSVRKQKILQNKAEHQLLQLPVRIDQLPREGEQAVNINTKVMKLKKVHLLSLCEDRSRQKNNPLQSLIAGDSFLLERHRKDNCEDST